MSEETTDEEAKIRVASYGNTTWQGGWRQRGRAWWGTGVVGTISGALIGAALVGVEIWLGMPLTTSTILAPIMGLAAVWRRCWNCRRWQCRRCIRLNLSRSC